MEVIPMDKDILIQYSDLVEEVKDLRHRIQKIQDHTRIIKLTKSK